MKDNKWLFIIPGLLAMVIIRFLYGRYGDNFTNKVIVIVSIIIILLGLSGGIYFLIKKYYWISLGIVTIFIPIILFTVGVYKGNENLTTLGLIALLLIMVGWYIFLRLYVKNKSK